MNSKTFYTDVEECWFEVRRYVPDSVVYLDNAAAECLHWFYGTDKFYEFGALAIENLGLFAVIVPK